MMGNVVESVLGGWDNQLSALVLFVAAEYLTQIMNAIVKKEISGEIGFCGIMKKVSIFFLVAVGTAIDALLGQNRGITRTAVIFFYVYYEGITILENVAALGLPIPQKLMDILKQLKDGKR